MEARSRNGTAWDQPRGRANLLMGIYKPKAKAKEREVMEALQNGKSPKELEKRYPPGLVRRLAILQEVAEDPEHKDFMHAQRLVREILARLQGGAEEDAASAGPAKMVIEVVEGRVDVPMPGSAGEDEPKESGPAQAVGGA